MKIKKGKGTTEYGKGVDIILTGEEVAIAVMTYLTAKGVYISGSRTITVNGRLCKSGGIYIDPSGFCIDKHGKKWDGRELCC